MHSRPSPFPRTLPDGRICIDEKCTCGRFRSSHEDTVAYGHGPYFLGDKQVCLKFSFATYVFEFDRQQPLRIIK